MSIIALVMMVYNLAWEGVTGAYDMQLWRGCAPAAAAEQEDNENDSNDDDNNNEGEDEDEGPLPRAAFIRRELSCAIAGGERMASGWRAGLHAQELAPVGADGRRALG
ncbi:hypothetical protein GGS24DRAFT_501814 [Hypoxylon argillaceum]|nr:hypothetical protein GGS24DRAFT_501814 [Hypoxylon argillaceum]